MPTFRTRTQPSNDVIESLYEFSQAKFEDLKWQKQKLLLGIVIDTEGNLSDIVPIGDEVTTKKGDTIFKSREYVVPKYPRPRGNTISPNFLCDNTTYMLGIKTSEEKEDGERIIKLTTCKDKFIAAGKFHSELMNDFADKPVGFNALLKFFETWDPENASKNPIINKWANDLNKNPNITFICYDDEETPFLIENPYAKTVWSNYYDSFLENLPEGRCIVTGKTGKIAVIHDKIMGIPGDSLNGYSLVSFNNSATESWGHNGDQALSAPILYEVNKGYTKAVSFMFQNDDYHINLSSSSGLIFWANTEDDVYSSIYKNAIAPDNNVIDQTTLASIIKNLAEGKHVEWNGTKIDPSTEFYTAIFETSSARCFVTMFEHNNFGHIMQNFNKFYNEIGLTYNGTTRYYDINTILRETLPRDRNTGNLIPNQKIMPTLASTTFNSILHNKPYPTSIFNSILQRLRSDELIRAPRIAILKAFLIRNYRRDRNTMDQMTPQEEAIYSLGRLLSICERAQIKAADKKLNTTVKDRFMSSAVNGPAHVYPQILQASDIYIAKLKSNEKKAGIGYNIEKQIAELVATIRGNLPKASSPQQKAFFYLGFYDQLQENLAKAIASNESDDDDNDTTDE